MPAFDPYYLPDEERLQDVYWASQDDIGYARTLSLFKITASPKKTTKKPVKSREPLPSDKQNQDYWIKKVYSPISRNGLSGKWLIFVPFTQVDECWKKVCAALEKGKLGPSAKVSTYFSSGEKDYVICVYTNNHSDPSDVMRVRKALRDIGITKSISYKTDEATLSGKYAAKGDRVSLYYC
jgi:hypothetical protein